MAVHGDGAAPGRATGSNNYGSSSNHRIGICINGSSSTALLGVAAVAAVDQWQ